MDAIDAGDTAVLPYCEHFKPEQGAHQAAQSEDVQVNMAEKGR